MCPKGRSECKGRDVTVDLPRHPIQFQTRNTARQTLSQLHWKREGSPKISWQCMDWQRFQLKNAGADDIHCTHTLHTFRWANVEQTWKAHWLKQKRNHLVMVSLRANAILAWRLRAVVVQGLCSGATLYSFLSSRHCERCRRMHQAIRTRFDVVATYCTHGPKLHWACLYQRWRSALWSLMHADLALSKTQKQSNAANNHADSLHSQYLVLELSVSSLEGVQQGFLCPLDTYSRLAETAHMAGTIASRNFISSGTNLFSKRWKSQD